MPTPADRPADPRDQPADPVDTVRAAVRTGGLLAGARGALVMLSGGRDSVCLLDVAVALMGAERVSALHVNYGIRPEAGGDEDHCRRLSQTLGVALDVARVQRPGPGGGNLQAWARDVRYARARELAAARGVLVAAGHTATDQLETVLYRLAASPGRRALLGMQASDGVLVRPLLAVTREQTTAYCRARGLAWRDDSSNDSLEYARGRVRNRLLPALADVHPAAAANVLRTAELLRDEAAALDEAVGAVLAGDRSIPLSRLRALSPALARLVVMRLAEQAAGGPLGSAGGRVGELMNLGERGGSASLDIGGGVRAVVEYGVLRMAAGADAETPDAEKPVDVAVRVPGSAHFGAWRLDFRLAGAGGRDAGPAATPADLAGPLAQTGEVALLDAAAVGEDVLVRAWRAGDRLKPAGGSGSRTLADVFTDRHVPRADRASLPVVEAHGLIAWVPGVAIDRRFRVREDGRPAVRAVARRERRPA